MSYIPKGCDQQGRYPEAAEAATEVGMPEEPEPDILKSMLVDILIVCAILATIYYVVIGLL